MSANPYIRTWLGEEGGAVSAEMQSRTSGVIWREMEAEAECEDDTGRAACRIRWAARLACARLRVELAEYKVAYLNERWGGCTPEERAELDRSRRVLAKLEGREP